MADLNTLLKFSQNQGPNIMTTNSDLLTRRNQAVARGVANMHNLYADHAENAEIWDVEGKRYIDFAGGIGVLNTGHRHAKVMAAVQAELDTAYARWQALEATAAGS